MKTKKIVLLVAAIGLLSISSGAKGQSYTVEGVVDSSLNDKVAYLYDNNTRSVIDSIQVENGKFVFSGSTDGVKYCMVRVERSGHYIILEPGSIAVDLSEYTVSGTPLNDALNAHNKEMSILYKERGKIYQDLKEKEQDQDKLKKEFESIIETTWKPKFTAQMEKDLNANVNNIIGGIIVMEMSASYSYSNEEMDAALAQLGADVVALPMVDNLIKNIEALKNTAVGRKFVDFTIDQPDGSTKSFSDYAGKGKYLLVDFWASWCGPCRAELPNLKELYNEYKGDKFEILGVMVWDKLKDTNALLEKEQLEWPLILDAQEVPIKLYGIKGIPQIMLIAPDGTIVARDLRGEEMKAKVAEVLSE